MPAKSYFKVIEVQTSNFGPSYILLKDGKKMDKASYTIPSNICIIFVNI